MAAAQGLRIEVPYSRGMTQLLAVAAHGLAAHGLHGLTALQGLPAAQGLHGLAAAHGFFAAQGLHGFLAMQGLLAAHGLRAAHAALAGPAAISNPPLMAILALAPGPRTIATGITVDARIFVLNGIIESSLLSH
ncbi:MAG: hypothetical protein JSU82_07135 [Rhodospirillales bacterium]|nr:MAG: hypothetical protein JSU82_07135 [Rhodospirillales bacterium]